MRHVWLILAAALLGVPFAAPASTVRIKDLGRFLGWRDNALVGYGIITGLSGSGDSPRSQVTRQALASVLGRMGATVAPEQLQSRNVAAVMVTATLPPAANVGDRIDVAVSSLGDARSLAGGMLLMTPLLGPDQRSYALAQGPVVVGGYRFDADLNTRQRNFPTSGVLPGGATVEASVNADLSAGGQLTFVLSNPDMTTAGRIAAAINRLGGAMAAVRDAASVSIRGAGHGESMMRLATLVEGLEVTPDGLARVVVNERTGTVVAGGDVRIESVVVSQGDIRVSVVGERQGFAPIASYDAASPGLVVVNTKLEVAEGRDATARLPDTNVAALVEALSRARVDTRGLISVLHAMKAAGALHADIIVR